MGYAPAPVTVLPNGSGNPLDGAIRRSPVDDAFGAMSSKLLILLRAVKINPANAAIIDSLGNPVTALTSGVTKNNSDSNFNGHETITFNNGNNQYAMQAGKIGIGSGLVAMTNSFTMLVGMRPTAAALCSLYGDTAGTTGTSATGAYIQTDGSFHALVGGTADLTANGAFPESTTGIFWWSYDAATKTHRIGLNSAAVFAQATGTQTRNGAGTSTICYPFGYQTSGSAGFNTFHRWALFNKAFMNATVPSDDQQFAGLLATYKNYLGL